MCPITSASLLGDTPEEEPDPEGDEQEEEEGEEEDRRRGHDRSLIMSLHDVVHPPPPHPQPLSDQPSDPLLDEISSPISAQIFDFCDPDIFPDTLQKSCDQNTSSPHHNCCCYEDQNSSYTTDLSFPSDVIDNSNNTTNQNKFTSEPPLNLTSFQDNQQEQTTNTSTTTSSTTTTAVAPSHRHHHHGRGGGLSIIFDAQDEIDNDISASIDFSPSPYAATTTNAPSSSQDQYQLPLTNTELSHYPPTSVDPAMVLPLVAAGPPPPLGTVFEDDCLSPIPPFLRLNPSVAAAAAAAAAAASSSSSCSFLDPSSIGPFLPGNLNHGLSSGDNSGIFSGNLLMPSELQAKDLDFQGDNGGIFCPDQLTRVYNSGDMQAFSNESSQMVSGATSSAPLATEISSLEDSTFKVGKLSVEQRKEKIHRYMKKRNERNFSKKIKYACRKTLADSRPRVRGRFAKNDDFGETNRHINGQHEEDEYDEVAVKEEDDLVNSSDILAQISGLNSFNKCNFQIPSWI